jgi:thiosulfate/3-mercaptopyruvate sulfurtransferase
MAYRRAHVAGAVCLQRVSNEYVKEPAAPLHVVTPPTMRAVLAACGIHRGLREIIVYDDTNSLLATRFRWVLQHYGFDNVRVLHGGWHQYAYVTKGPLDYRSTVLPSSATQAAAAAAQEEYSARRDTIAMLDDVKAIAAADNDATTTSGLTDVLLDARSDGEWTGVATRNNKRVGPVPNAVHYEWTNSTCADDGRLLLPPAELAAALKDAGLDPAAPATRFTTYCQAGIRAAHAAFVLELMGAQAPVRVYDGSMQEYHNVDL